MPRKQKKQLCTVKGGVLSKLCDKEKAARRQADALRKRLSREAVRQQKTTAKASAAIDEVEVVDVPPTKRSRNENDPTEDLRNCPAKSTTGTLNGSVVDSLPLASCSQTATPVSVTYPVTLYEEISLPGPANPQADRRLSLATKAKAERERKARQTEEQRKERLARDAEAKRRRGENQTETQRLERLAKAAEDKRRREERHTEDQRLERLAKAAEDKRRREERQTEDQRLERLAKAAEDKRRREERQTEDQRLERLAKAAEDKRRREERQTEDQRLERLAKAAEDKRRREERQTEAERLQILKAKSESEQRRQTRLTEAARQNRLLSNAAHRREQRRQQAAALESSLRADEAALEQSQRDFEDESAAPVQPDLAPTNLLHTHLAAAQQDVSDVEEFSCGDLDVACQTCGAMHFPGERPSDRKFKTCCHKGKVLLEPLFPYPELLHNLLTNGHPESRNFRDHIRQYNSSLSFASVGAKTELPQGYGTYCFRVHGNIQHRIGNLGAEAQRPMYSHLYFLDADLARAARVERRENEDMSMDLLHDLDALIRERNPYAHGLKTLGEVEKEERARAEAENRPPVKVDLLFLDDRRRTYEAPTSHDVAIVYQSVDGGMPPLERNIRIHTRDGFLEQLSVLSPNTDPMSYVLLFPLGDPGWQRDMPHTRNSAHGKITLLEFYSYRLQLRQGEFNPILHGGKLTQQFIVDAYVKVEGNRLEYITKNQNTLRTELYRGLMDHLENRAARMGVVPGKMVILPSTFIGSPRHFQQLYQDAMAIVTRFGQPDLLVTITCNPKWPEIVSNIEEYERAADRPDLTARVFHLKLQELMVDITKRHVLGVPVAEFHVVEFQKRGLPHAHILIVLRAEDKIRTPEQVDALICAELPDKVSEPNLHSIVVSSMVHGPCGARRPNCVCMKDGQCGKHYPKKFAETTVLNEGGFTEYRRRDDGRRHTLAGNIEVDNRDVVPYNKYLSSKYNCHLNVEHCGTAKTVKYLCKYIYKGHDKATVELRVSAPAHGDNGQLDAGGQRELAYDEVRNFIDSRYVSAPEAVWRLLEFEMHGKSHSIIRLAIHLQGEHTVVFRPGDEEAAVERASATLTTLTAWFSLNGSNPDARRYKYMDIPYHYVFSRTAGGNTWTPRKRGGNSIVSRMYSVSPKQIERYHLRLLLLHVAGATCYEDVRTYRGVVYDTFKEAAISRNLLLDDDEWERCLEEAATFQMPCQLRQLFAVICAFCEPTQPALLWERFKADFSEDFARDNDPVEAEQMALNSIQAVLALHRLTNEELGLPTPRVPVMVAVEERFDPAIEKAVSEENVATLNQHQREAFDAVMAAVDNPDAEQRCFFLDGPGGSGKTFLYNTLISTLRARGERAVAVAWTGIAATLLKGGRTCHSRFRLPVPIVENSTSGVQPNSAEGGALRSAKMIILDEGPMAPSMALNVIHRTMCDITGDDRPFGGKVVVIGGDFRQCLPVVRNGNRVTITEQCLKRCTLWPLFRTLALRANMRANEGEDDFVEWLLRVGNGELLNEHHLPQDTIALPQQCVVKNIVDAVFGETVSAAQMPDIQDFAILCPKNTESLSINDEVLERLEGQVREYSSADSIEWGEGDDGDALASDYPIEFVNSLTPSGMPPHKLRLKKHAVVMLLRNVNVRAGLCNGTRLSVVSMQENFIDCKIIAGRCAGERAFLSRINLQPSDVGLPFTMKRRQFPIRLAFAMTINKAQGQTLRRVGIYLEKPVFGHGQLYVALSRARSLDSVFVSVVGNESQGKLIASSDLTFTKNIVYHEVLH